MKSEQYHCNATINGAYENSPVLDSYFGSTTHLTAKEEFKAFEDEPIAQPHQQLYLSFISFVPNNDFLFCNGWLTKTNSNISRYEQLVHAIIRPPRARYKMEQLGPAEFTFLGQRFRRDDVELLSSNISKNTPTSGEGNLEGGGTPTCSFLKLQASIWTRVNTDGEASPANPYSPTRPVAKSEEDAPTGKGDRSE